MALLWIVVTIFALVVILAHRTSRRRADRAVALNFDLSLAQDAHGRRTGISAAATLRLDREFRRWFVVAAASPVLIGLGSRAVDEYWHTLLGVEDGQLYGRFCQAVAGRHVAHVEGVGSDDLNARAWVAYEAVWGRPPPADLFPRPPADALARHRATASGGGEGGGFGDTVSLCFDGAGDGGSGDSGGGDGGGCGGGGCGGGGGE